MPEPLAELSRPLSLPAAQALSYQRSVLAQAGSCSIPDGWREVATTASVGVGVGTFDSIADDLLALTAYARAGVRMEKVEPSRPTDIEILEGPLRGRCRLVDKTDESLRQGFVVGTLEGHPTVAEHRCHVFLDPDTGAVTATVRTTWRPSSAFLLPGARGRQSRAFRRMGERIARALGGAESGVSGR